MALSLREQMLKAGLVNQKQAKQAGKEQKNNQRLAHKGQIELDDSQKRAALQSMAEKTAHDQQLNREHQEKAQKKAEAAQIKQLIEHSRLPKLTGEDYYNFVDEKKVKRLSVNSLMRNKLSQGSLAIVRQGSGYEVIPREAALKIQERDPSRVLLLNTATEAPDADDPYAAYQVPDDLMW
jgi:uncharacterized protein YaiL (DUF2058 family)